MAIRFDSVGGASGDMILAALIGLGADSKQITAALKSLKLGKFAIKTGKAVSRGMAGLRVNVAIPHQHCHTRCLGDIDRMIKSGRLSSPAKNMSLAVFRRLAEAEAMVHGTTPDKIHFHEVGAVDSIVDIVGSCLALDMLGVRHVSVGPLPCGVGTIQMAHGQMPNPAPATAALLKGFEVTLTDEPFELVTPTAAALLSTWSGSLGSSSAPTCRIAAVSTAVGHRTLQHRPNTLRAILMQPQQAESAACDTSDKCVVLETNIDDMSPELVAPLFDKLLKAGALDVFTAPIQMKKQRTGILLTVLCHAPHRDALLDVIFRETTTFGVREYESVRTTLQRRIGTVATRYGKIRVKIGTWRGHDVTVSPEYDDCAAAAEKRGVPVRVVYDAAARAARKL